MDRYTEIRKRVGKVVDSLPHGVSALTTKRKNGIRKRDNFTCQYCGIYVEKPHVDHVIPVNWGAMSHHFNLVASCVPCNTRKTDTVWIPNNITYLREQSPIWASLIEELAAIPNYRHPISIKLTDLQQLHLETEAGRLNISAAEYLRRLIDQDITNTA